MAGEGPHPKEKLPVKRYLQKNINVTIASDGCLVVNKLGKKFVQRTLIVIPEDISRGLLHGLHINLNHPTSYQLQMAVDTRFFLLDRDKKIRDVWDSCTLCQSVAKIPVEIHNYQPNQMPDHPGKSFTVDILRTGKRFIMVSMENFSGFLATAFLPSEKADILLEGLIQIISPFKASSPSLVTIRTDKAPGFKALKGKTAELKDLGIDMDLGEPKNKNSTALVDRKMQELETEIKKLSPNHNFISVKILARATSAVNEKIRNQGLSSKEILFSRDQYSHANLPLVDKSISETVMQERNTNNSYSARSKAQVQKQASSANAKKGQTVFLKNDGSKLKARDLYLVTHVDDVKDEVTICKILNSLDHRPASIHPHAHTYKVKQTDIYLAPNQPITICPEIIYADWFHIFPESNQAVDTFYQPQRPLTKTSPKLLVNAADRQEQVFWVLDDEVEGEETRQDIHDVHGDPLVAEDLVVIAVDDSVVPATIDEYLLSDRDSQSADVEDNEEDSTEQEREDSSSEEDFPLAAQSTEDEENNLQNRDLNPLNLPNPGDRIIYWDPNLECGIKASIIPMHRTMQVEWPGWRNVRIENTGQSYSVNMDQISFNCVSWRYLDGGVPQVDGNYTVDVATQSTPTQNVSVRLREVDFHPSTQNLTVTLRNIPPIPPGVSALNLGIPPDGRLSPSRVYRFPHELPTQRPHSQPPPERRQVPRREPRSRAPNFLSKLNPFKKK